MKAWKASGLSAVQYANDHHLNPSTLMWWASAMKRDGSGSRAVKPRRRVGGAAAKAASLVPFLPVRVISPKVQPTGEMTVQAEILLEGGRRVRLAGAVPLGQLARLLDAVEGGARC